MPDFAVWALVDAFTVKQAACLWAGAEPAESDTARQLHGKMEERDRIAAITQMLTAAIQAGNLPADTSANAMAMIGDHAKSSVTREALQAFAEEKDQHPAFLFDTLLPESAAGDSETGVDAPPRPSRGGRPPEYDWDGLIIEIIRIADTPDGLPEKQSELIGELLQWCENTWGVQPAESSVKAKVSSVYNGLGRGQKSQ
ncbi:MAG: hypothetical protein P8M79_02425 [Alphaproteobacteria bacterium]|nr:hypothetical protein [Alphaproteobacteria bacterium]